MTSTQPTLKSKSSLEFDELRWVIQIRRALEEEIEEYCEVPVCIFNVPKALLVSDPDSYTPQEVALGPYHHWRPELYEMERYKIAAAKRTQNQLPNLDFQNLVDQLMKLEHRIRACYHKYLDFNGETLAWMMAVDASFLLEFLQAYSIKRGRLITRVSSRMSHLLDYAGTKSAHNAILRDMVMLENQIPLFVLRKMLELHCSSLKSLDDMLVSMFTGLCKELSPFKVMEDLSKIEVSECFHLLDFLYLMIVPKMEEPSAVIEVPVQDQSEGKPDDKRSSLWSSFLKENPTDIWTKLSQLKLGPLRLIKNVLASQPVKIIQKLPSTMLSKLPGLRISTQPSDYLLLLQDKELQPGETSSSDSNISESPLAEEITIPSVTKLLKSGFRFSPAKGSISTISFDSNTFTLYLPTITLDVNTEVFMRNLVAYEASSASGPLVFTRYTELMNDIIDTEEDVKALGKRRIMFNHLRSDGEAADLWNGMSKSIRLTKVPLLDKVIEDVNKHYNSRWRVKVIELFKLYVVGSWQFLTMLATIAVLLLMMLQSFCSVYSCPDIVLSLK